MQVKAIETGIRAAVGLGTFAYNMYRARKGSAKAVVKKSRAVVPRRTYVPRNVSRGYMTLRRQTNVTAFALTAGVDARIVDITLNQVYTADLLTSWDVYRIRKATIQIVPRIDAGNSGVVNNQVLHVWAANDTVGQATPPTAAINVAQYSNYKYGNIPSGQRFVYTWYPKALNTVDNNGVATAAGSYGSNPWIAMTSAGIQIPHKRLLWYLGGTGGVSTAAYEFCITIYFDVKRNH